jgi:predicted transcriptional regulator
MTAVRIPSELAPYLDELVEVLRRSAPVEAVYLLGSASFGAYEHGRSDVDVVAVTSRSLSVDERRTLAAAVEAVPVPARNLDTGEHLGLDPDAEPTFWFVLDRAIAEQHALPLHGPPWAELFEPVSREAIEAALDEAGAFRGWSEASSELAVARGRAWRETGRWVSKREAQEWLG